MINLHRLDLNLLRTLDVLLSEHNVTRAAQRLNLSQPSVSIQLARLRDIFADPLLLPGPRGMLPTARADELRGPLRDALQALELAVAPADAFVIGGGSVYRALLPWCDRAYVTKIDAVFPELTLFDGGGLLERGDIAVHAAAKPDRVLTDAQWRAVMTRLADADRENPAPT